MPTHLQHLQFPPALSFAATTIPAVAPYCISTIYLAPPPATNFFYSAALLSADHHAGTPSAFAVPPTIAQTVGDPWYTDSVSQPSTADKRGKWWAGRRLTCVVGGTAPVALTAMTDSDPKTPQDLSDFADNLLKKLQEKFQVLSDQLTQRHIFLHKYKYNTLAFLKGWFTFQLTFSMS
ncbi:hypothetical protein XELAEV_18031745mg [Xenopus laevis]|uniref:Uncharacterized protein n=1 Tax=Xenopus laevis TaxID=8355 RepID=A0A974CPC7_XENLA|nr:hypothetical protein XELAEV_18031745mg [Xenopus laevis]